MQQPTTAIVTKSDLESMADLVDVARAKLSREEYSDVDDRLHHLAEDIAAHLHAWEESVEAEYAEAERRDLISVVLPPGAYTLTEKGRRMAEDCALDEF